ncbi:MULTISPECIES: hypothetical protein [Deinococcus]|uniref:Uncharacterized protein n=1 Tax=Deinococcus rufus TaxID=2136097 RepID=A0ABV7ZDP2_9DEIO|nr:hypothetical protein [Deinococcus sp. AB2017081]WQE94079.1 hypothetical protein U2P90_11730 [Deinococcus sp. AB2017081]
MDEVTFLVQGVLVTGKLAFPVGKLEPPEAARLQLTLDDAVACMGLEQSDLFVLFEARIFGASIATVESLVLRRDAVGGTLNGHLFIDATPQVN